MKRVFICMSVVGGLIFSIMIQRNERTHVQMEIPQVMREIKILEEKNNQLRFEIECFDNPLHLMELLRLPEYSHLKMPYRDEVNG